MMSLYGAEHHLLVLSDTIDADEHAHSFVQVTVSLDAAFEIEIEGVHMRCRGMVIDSNIRHRLQAAGTPLLLLLMDRTSHMASCFNQRMGNEGYVILEGSIAGETAEFVRHNYSVIQDSASYGFFLKEVLERLQVKVAQPRIMDPRVSDCIRHLQACDGPEHSIGYYAQRAGVSASRLSHLFKAGTGISLSGYIVLHKLQKAVYLVFGGVPITEAALTAGFDSPSHFAATSKRLLGMAAKDIRKDSVFLKVSCLHLSYA